MDVSVAVGKGTAYALTIMLGILPAAIIMLLLQGVFPLTISIALTLVLAVTLALLFNKIYPFSERLVQKGLFRSRLSYYQVLRKFSKDMVAALDLRNLLERFDQTLREAMQVTSVAVYLTGPLNGKYPLTHVSKNGKRLTPVFSADKEHPDEEAAPDAGVGTAAAHHSGAIPFWKSGDSLVAMAYKAKDVLVLGEMEMMADRDDKKMHEAIAQMKEAKAEVCLPLKRDGKMIGIALLGPREGDRYYSPQDLELLHVLGQNACVAVQNALLVEEIKKSYQLLHRTQKLAAMGSIIAGVSHEIRNPLMPISFLMDAIKESFDDRDFVMRLHKHSQESLHRITNVLEEMDELARPYTPVFKKADINQIVDEALLFLGTQVNLWDQEVTKDYSSLPEVLVDPERLKQAFMDILLNAVEANSQGGKILLSTRLILLKKTKALPERPGVQIEVKDTGCGIPQENLDRVFDPFFTTKHKSLMREGTGLGLAIVHKIIEEHGGSVEIRSTEGRGTSVFVNLPVDR